jgi:UDP-3-O-[3-hydroxymyristoyl] glucosamine N-acyltransferase
MVIKENKDYTLGEIAELIDAHLIINSHYDENYLVSGLDTLSAADETKISFLSNKKYRKDLLNTSAAAVILLAEDAKDCRSTCLVHKNPYLAYAKLSALFSRKIERSLGIHKNSSVSKKAKLGKNVTVCAGSVIMDDVIVGDNCYIGPNCVIENSATLGDSVSLTSNVVINHFVQIKNDVSIQSGSVIGSDGFGYAYSGNLDNNNLWEKINHSGIVIIGNRVQIGANTTIDRGALGNTLISDDVIIDNQVHIAHNVSIGRGTAIAGCTGIAGSVTIGENCRIAGGVGITGHLSITNGVTILSMTRVNNSISEPGVYASGTIMQNADDWRKNVIRFKHLDNLYDRVKKIEDS